MPNRARFALDIDGLCPVSSFACLAGSFVSRGCILETQAPPLRCDLRLHAPEIELPYEATQASPKTAPKLEGFSMSLDAEFPGWQSGGADCSDLAVRDDVGPGYASEVNGIRHEFKTAQRRSKFWVVRHREPPSYLQAAGRNSTSSSRQHVPPGLPVGRASQKSIVSLGGIKTLQQEESRPRRAGRTLCRHRGPYEGVDFAAMKDLDLPKELQLVKAGSDG
jgi:hypothetical protein